MKSGSGSTTKALGPHANQPISTAGPRPQEAAGTLILLHGRGTSAASILPIYQELGIRELAAIAPQAAGNTWYPHTFLAALESNEPYLSSALARVESIVAGLMGEGIASERIAILGFSQGACLTTEFAARHPQRYGAIIGLTGGLIGPPGTARNYAGSLAGTAVFLGTSDPDPHVPFARVQETQSVLSKMGAEVELRRYPGLPHTICEDEIEISRLMLQRMLESQNEEGTHDRR